MTASLLCLHRRRSNYCCNKYGSTPATAFMLNKLNSFSPNSKKHENTIKHEAACLRNIIVPFLTSFSLKFSFHLSYDTQRISFFFWYFSSWLLMLPLFVETKTMWHKINKFNRIYRFAQPNNLKAALCADKVDQHLIYLLCFQRTMDSRGLTSCLIKLLAFFVMLIHHVGGHGRLMEPPARNAMWRFGFPNPVNYNDNEVTLDILLHFSLYSMTQNVFLLFHLNYFSAFLRRLCG